MSSNFKWIQIFAVVIFSTVLSEAVLAGQIEDEVNEINQQVVSRNSFAEKLAALKKLSASGNSTASRDLGVIYIDSVLSKRFGVVIDQKVSIRFLELAIKQGNETAADFLHNISQPTKPYPPKIGMSKAQVDDCEWGSPRDKRKTTTQSGTTEVWVYAGPAFIFFDAEGHVEEIRE